MVGKSMDFETARDDFLTVRDEYPSSAAVFHSRFGTHGDYGLVNVHPFYVNTDSVMVHNGVLPRNFLPRAGDFRSDTRVFVDTVARPIVGKKTVPSQREAKSMQGKIGYGNKLVFLGIGPSVRIIGADQGVWENGCWFSNTQFRPAPVYSWQTRGTGGSLGWPGWPRKEPCFNCGSMRIDLVGGVCMSCWACQDCASTYLEGCKCRYPYTFGGGKDE